MNKICYKVLNISDSYLFRSKKFFIPNFPNKIDIENDVKECKQVIYNKYRNQSVTIFKFDKSKLNSLNNDFIKLNYDAVIDYHDIMFDENNVMKYFNSIDNIEKKLK